MQPLWTTARQDGVRPCLPTDSPQATPVIAWETYDGPAAEMHAVAFVDAEQGIHGATDRNAAGCDPKITPLQRRMPILT